MAFCRQGKAHKLKTFSPVTPHFCKRIRPTTLLHDKLRIPKDFVLKYGTTLSDPVNIKVASGEQFEMGLKEQNGDVWLAKGWPDFAKRYALENGQALFSKYNGRSMFDVVIIGKKGLEIDYPIHDSTHFDVSNIDGSDDNGDDGVSIEEKSAPRFSRTHERKKRNLVGDLHTQCSSDEMSPENRMSKGDNLHCSKSKGIRGMNSHNRFGENIFPVNLVRRLLFMFQMEGSGEYSFTPELLAQKQHSKLHSCEEVGRNLLRGIIWTDVCIFELADKNNLTFNVTIDHRCKENTKLTQADKEDHQNNPSTRVLKIQCTSQENQEACNISPVGEISEKESERYLQGHKFGNPPLNKDHTRNQQHVPHSFEERYFEQKEQNVTLEVGKQMWLVRMVVCSSGHIFADGWLEFVRDNNIRLGQFYAFELVRREEDHIWLKVTKIP